MRDQTYFKDRAQEEMKFNLPEAHFSKKLALALSCQILASEGHESGLAGQITARDEIADRFLTLQFGYGFEEASEELIVQVDDDLRSAQAGAMANPATRFHLWVYRARPDVQAIVHTHPPYTSALTMIGEPLKIGHMDSTMLAGQVAHLKDWPGLPVADDEGRIISQALGDKKAILLAHHGLLTAGVSVQEACYLAVFFERAARAQIRAMGAGVVREVEAKLAEEAGNFLRQASIVNATFAYWARRLVAKD
jgi:L-fuculose-phosphate aldolase